MSEAISVNFQVKFWVGAALIWVHDSLTYIDRPCKRCRVLIREK